MKQDVNEQQGTGRLLLAEEKHLLKLGPPCPCPESLGPSENKKHTSAVEKTRKPRHANAIPFIQTFPPKPLLSLHSLSQQCHHCAMFFVVVTF